MKLQSNMKVQSNVKLLLVEDDEDDYILLRSMLEDIIAGEYSLTWVSNAQEARHHFEKNSHDLCLLDYHLGSEDGLSLLRAAPELGFAGPIIILTGHDDKQLDNDALNAGAEDYLLKSQLNAEGLAHTIRYALTRREMEAERAERLQAETESRAKSEFLAHLSHELRTPLTAILGYTDLMLTTDQAPDKKHLHIIKRNGRHLLGLLNNILDLSKMDAGKLELDLLDVPLHSFIDEISALVSVNAQDKDLSLLISASTPLPTTIKTDPTRLRQVLLNLLGNAIKFTHEGTVSLTIAEIELAEKAYLQFSIEDSGIGIASDDLDKLFKPFAQVADASSLRQQGTGLGLAISHQLVQHLGGEISVVSQPGIGSKFTLYIDPGELEGVPREELKKASKLDTTSNLATVCFDGHILVADDLPDIRFLIGQLIASFGGRVSYASNGQEAIALVNEKAGQQDAFDLLIMDMQMPVMDGLSATRQLRAQGYDKPILALTAATLRGECERCLEAGCNEYLGKPIDTVTLIRCVSVLLAQSRGESEVEFSVSRKQILLVEDDRDAREVTTLLLNHLGWQVTAVANGAEALQAVKNVQKDAQPAIVLLDINLPDIDGYALAAALRKNGLTDSRLIALSGEQPNTTRARAGVFDSYLMKPLALDELSVALDATNEQ